MKRFLFFIVIFFSVFLGCNSQTQKNFAAVQKIFVSQKIPLSSHITVNTISDFLADLNTVFDLDTQNMLILVDKKHFLKPDYEPDDLVHLQNNTTYTVNRSGLRLRLAVEKALREMAVAAKKDGITLPVSSAYRSYEYQKTVYERNVKELGKEQADRESAMPGASQHQLGTVIDFGSISDDFAQTKAGMWLLQNAADYGFSLSFPQGYEEVTGYRWESWHYRYVGKEAAAFQKKWFNNIQQYMLLFLNEYRISLITAKNSY